MKKPLLLTQLNTIKILASFFFLFQSSGICIEITNDSITNNTKMIKTFDFYKTNIDSQISFLNQNVNSSNEIIDSLQAHIKEIEGEQEIIAAKLESKRILQIVQIIGSILAPFLAFFLAYILYGYRDNKREEKRLDDLKKYLGSVLEILTTSMEILESDLNILLNSISQKRVKSPTYTERTNTGVNNFNDIPKLDLYKILISKIRNHHIEKNKHYCAIIDSVELLALNNKIVKENIDYFLDRQSEYEKRWNDNINRILGLYNEFITEAIESSGAINKDKYLVDINLIITDWQSLNEYNDPFVACPNLIEPLIQISQSYESDKRLDLLMPPVMECQSAFGNIKHAKNKFSGNLIGIIDVTINVKKKFKKAISFYKNSLNIFS